jgi:hypothetical protein
VNLEAKRKRQREWARLHRKPKSEAAKKKERERWQLPEVKARRARRDSANRNHRNNRRGWQLLKFRGDLQAFKEFGYHTLTIVSGQELMCPAFIVERNGSRTREFMNEPLPTW